MKKWKKATACALAALTVCFSGAALGWDPVVSLAADDFSCQPLVVTSDEKRLGTETFRYDLTSDCKVTGNYLAIKLYVKNASLPTVWLKCSVTDGSDTLREMTSFTGLRARDCSASGDTVYTSLDNAGNSFVEVPYGFYGFVYIPYRAFSDPSAIGSVTLGFGAQTLGYDSLLEDIQNVYVFGVYDVTLDGQTVTESARSTVVDFTQLQPSDVSQTANAKTVISKATEYDMDSLEYAYQHRTDPCKRIGDVKVVQDFDKNSALAAISDAGAAQDRTRTYSRMGQNSELTFTASGLAGEGEMLKYTVSTEKLSDSNAYASVHFNLAGESRDWSGAKGVTVYVENPGMGKYSFAIEIFLYNTKTHKTEQYNLNATGDVYRKVYAYNTQTGEEFSYNTQTFVRIPANFKGWLRIPFSEYQAPAWTKASAYGNEGIFDTQNYRVVKISLSRLFNDNAGATLYLDNLGAYYNDFSVGGLFDFSETAKPSMKECLQGGGKLI